MAEKANAIVTANQTDGTAEPPYMQWSTQNAAAPYASQSARMATPSVSEWHATATAKKDIAANTTTRQRTANSAQRNARSASENSGIHRTTIGIAARVVE